MNRLYSITDTQTNRETNRHTNRPAAKFHVGVSIESSVRIVIRVAAFLVLVVRIFVIPIYRSGFKSYRQIKEIFCSI